MKKFRMFAIDCFAEDKENFSDFQARIKKVSKEKGEELANEIWGLLSPIKLSKNDVSASRRNDDVDGELAPKIKELVLQGADVSILFKNDNFLVRSAKAGLIECFKIFIRAGMDIDIQNGYGTTATMAACMYNFPEILKLCVLLNANLDMQCSDGDCAFHCASRHNREECIDILNEAGANPTIKNNDGKTPLDVAENKSKMQAVVQSRLIKEFGCTQEDIEEAFMRAREEFNAIKLK